MAPGPAIPAAVFRRICLEIRESLYPYYIQTTSPGQAANPPNWEILPPARRKPLRKAAFACFASQPRLALTVPMVLHSCQGRSWRARAAPAFKGQTRRITRLRSSSRRLRSLVRKGKPYPYEESPWQQTTTRELGLESSARRPGRPKKEPE